jgi:hypothetical protein
MLLETGRMAVDSINEMDELTVKDLNVVVTDDLEYLYSRREQIRRLSLLAAPPCLYVSYEFVWAHLNVFPNKTRLIYFIYHGVELVGFTAIASREGADDVFQFAAQTCLGYSGVLAAVGMESVVVKAFLEDIAGRSSMISLFDTGPIREGGAQLFSSITEEVFGARAKVHAMTGAPYIQTSSDFFDWKSTLKKAAYKDSVRAERRLVEAGSVESFVIDNRSSVGDIETAVNVFFTLHLKRREGSYFGANQAAYDPKLMREFYLRLAVSAAESGIFELSFLTLNKRPIAAHFGFIQNHWRYYFTPAYDPEYGNLSPGKVLMRKLIEASFQNGDVFDFQNDMDVYKLDWSNNVANRYWIRIPLTEKYRV